MGVDRLCNTKITKSFVLLVSLAVNRPRPDPLAGPPFSRAAHDDALVCDCAPKLARLKPSP